MHLRSAANRLVDLNVPPNDRNITEVLHLEYRREPTDPALLTDPTTPPLFHVAPTGRASRDWPSDHFPVAPRNVFRLLGDTPLCMALAKASHYLTPSQECNLGSPHEVTSLLIWLHDQVILDRKNSPPTRRTTPRGIPVFSDYSLVVTDQRTWRLAPEHFGDYNMHTLPESDEREIWWNHKNLSAWIYEATRDRWIKDPVARYAFLQECHRIQATEYESPIKAPVTSNILLTRDMTQPLRIPRLR